MFYLDYIVEKYWDGGFLYVKLGVLICDIFP